MSGQDGSMQLTKLGHACLHVTHGDASVLIDPGTFSSGFEELRDLDAILIIHQHRDHLAMPEMEYQRFERLRPAGTEVRVQSDGASTGLP